MIEDTLLGRIEFSIIDNQKEGLIIESKSNGSVEFKLSKNNVYRILVNRDLIVGGLNKKFTELIEKKIQFEAKKEEQMEKEK